MKLTPLSTALGALVEHFDPRDAHDHDWDALHAALYETHHLLLLRGFELADDEHVDFCARFGPLGRVGTDGARRFSYISNACPDGILGPLAASWHFDYAFTAHPLEAISLYGVAIPAGGTQTWFANAKVAAADLPEAMRQRLADLTVRNVIDVKSPEGEAGVRVRIGRLDESYPHHVWPALWPHWRTGEPILPVNQQQTDAILPLPAQESAELIETLFDHIYRPDHIYLHEWREHDLVIWDNHALHHGRPEVGSDHARTLRRVSIGQSPDLSIFAKR